MRPVVLLGVGVEAKELLQFLICTFRLPVGPGVKHRRGVLFDTECLADFDGKTAHESGVSVVDNCSGESYTFEDVFQVEFSDSLSCDCFNAWY